MEHKLDSVKEASEFYFSFQEMMTRSGAENRGKNLRETYGKYLSIKWEQEKVLIASSMNESAVKNVLEGT